MSLKAALVFAGLMGFAYLGYPFIAFILSRLVRRPVMKGCYQPAITVVLPVYNEGDRLIDKVHNLLAQRYPAAKTEIVVVDDGSHDGSIERLEAEHLRGVSVVRLPGRGGKASALNAGIQNATGEVIVFTDARQDLADRALPALMSNFADARVSAVTGRILPAGASADSLFRRYEEALRSWEASWGSCTGATGALYAVRRGALAAIPSDTILDDLLISLSAARQGRLVYEKNAAAIEYPQGRKRIWARRLRTLAGNWQMLLHPQRFKAAFASRMLPQIICHKGLRLLFPFFSAGFVISMLAAFPRESAVCLAAVAAGIAAGVALRRSGRLPQMAELPMSLFLAPIQALLRYAFGRETVLWAK
jgi:cellulose synthase/poly-beta-1,6-N-acetylglucosamine synthase-like glycosyltransferase